MTYFPSVRYGRPNRPLTCLADACEILDDGSSPFLHCMPDDLKQQTSLRKLWEWDYIADSAKNSNMLDKERTGIGLGVGREPLIFYFSNQCSRIIATDLYSADSSWEFSRFATTEAVLATSPIPFPKERVAIHNMDMRRLDVPDQCVDFSWSCSSIEHVPTLKDILRIFDELARVLKIGGYAYITTEFCVTEPPYLLPGVNAWDAGILGCLREALEAFEFVGPTNLSYNFAHPANAPVARRYLAPSFGSASATPLLSEFRHGQVGVMAGLSVLVPLGMTLRRVPGRNRDWKDVRISHEIRTYTECVERVQSRKVSGAADMIRPLVQNGPGALGLQFYHHIFRIYIEAMAIDSSYTSEDVTKEILQFIEFLPAGPVQDADCLDLLSYLLGEAGENTEAARITRMAMLSPSTLYEHTVKLAYRYLHQMCKLGKFGDGIEQVVLVLADLATSTGRLRLAAEMEHSHIPGVLTDSEESTFRGALESQLSRNIR